MVDEIKPNETTSKEAPEVEETASTPLLDKTEVLVNKLTEQNNRAEAANARTEALQSRDRLGGQTQISEAKPEITEEQKAQNVRLKAVGEATGSKWAKKYS